MSNEQVGMLLIGVGVLVSFGKQFYELLFKPKEDLASDLSNQEKKFIEELHKMQLQYNEYQKQILEQLGKLNGIMSVQDSKLVRLDEAARENRKDLKDIHARVSVVESRLENKANK